MTTNEQPVIDKVTAPATKVPTKIDKGDIWITESTFNKGAKGFNFYVVEGKKLNGLVNHFNRVDPGKGEDTVLSLANRALAALTRQRAQTKLPDDDAERLRKIERGEITLIDVDDALSWKIGERELTSITGIQKALKAVKVEMEKVKGKDEARYNALRLEGKKLLVDLNKATAALSLDIE